MAKGTVYYCSECGYKSVKWAGKCPECGAWSSFEEVEELPKDVKKATSLISVASRNSDIKVYEFKDVEYTTFFLLSQLKFGFYFYHNLEQLF